MATPSRRLESTDLETLDDTQKIAIVEALMTSALADGKVDVAEAAALEREIARLPWGIDKPVMAAFVKGAVLRIAALKEPQQVADFVVGVAARLPSPELREKVFFTMAAVAVADRRMNQLEKNVLGAFVLAFGITTEQVNAIKAELTARSTGAVP